MTHKLDIVKLDHAGNEVIRYPGTVLAQTDDYILLEAYFAVMNVPVGPISFNIGDRFVETYYFDRWYNIFEVHDGDSEIIKGYYCNIGYPAEFGNGEISYRDLALDLLVLPDGHQIVMDEDEFAALALDEADARQARQALRDVQVVFRQKVKPKG
ncbi:MAG TPA: DUF402 domain-containing protein [Anaerolineales bacterium]|nr:DUF402 domain-containing protein [Anaerolineales bacterium]